MLSCTSINLAGGAQIVASATNSSPISHTHTHTVFLKLYKFMGCGSSAPKQGAYTLLCSRLAPIRENASFPAQASVSTMDDVGNIKSELLEANISWGRDAEIIDANV